MRCISIIAAIVLKTGKASINGVRVYFSFNWTGEKYFAQHGYTLRIIVLRASMPILYVAPTFNP